MLVTILVLIGGKLHTSRANFIGEMIVVASMLAMTGYMVWSRAGRMPPASIWLYVVPLYWVASTSHEDLGPGPGRVEDHRDLDLFNILQVGHVSFRYPIGANHVDMQVLATFLPAGHPRTTSLSFELCSSEAPQTRILAPESVSK